MTKTLIATFTNSDNAVNAINKLKKAGLDPKTMSIVMNDRKDAKRVSDQTEIGNESGSMAVSGAGTGAIVGGVAGLLIGLGAIAIPGVGALLIGGPIAAALGLGGAAATTLSGAITGAAAGGLLGALLGLGVPKEEAEDYQNAVKNGATLIAVPIIAEDENIAKSIIDKNNPDKLRIINSPQETDNNAETKHIYQNVVPNRMVYTEETVNEEKFNNSTDHMYSDEVKNNGFENKSSKGKNNLHVNY